MRDLLPPNKKILKLYEKIERRSSGEVRIPEIKLSGNWLERQGFNIGGHVELTYGHEFIVIYPHSKEFS